MFCEIMKGVNSSLVSELLKPLSRVLISHVNHQAPVSHINDIRCMKEEKLNLLGTSVPASDLICSEQTSFLRYAAGKAYYEGSPGTPNNYYLVAWHLIAAYEGGNTHILGILYLDGKGLKVIGIR